MSGTATAEARAEHCSISVPEKREHTWAPESFLVAGEKGKLSTQKAEYRRFTRQPPHSSNMRPGRKRQEKSWNPFRFGFFSFFSFFFFFFFSFFCQSTYWSWGQGGKGNSCMTQKTLLRADAKLGTLELLSCRGWGEEGWGLSPDPSRWGKMILPKLFAQWAQSTPLSVKTKSFLLCFLLPFGGRK